MNNIYYPHEQKHYSVIKCLHMQSNMDLGMVINKKDINTTFICYNYIHIIKMHDMYCCISSFLSREGLRYVLLRDVEQFLSGMDMVVVILAVT